MDRTLERAATKPRPRPDKNNGKNPDKNNENPPTDGFSFMERTGVEPVTYALQRHRSPN